MNVKTLFAVLLSWCFCLSSVFGFSPYEAYLMSGRETHVGLIAVIHPEKRPLFENAVKKCRAESVQSQLADAGIDHVQFFTRIIEGKEYAVVYFAFGGGKQYLQAAKAFEEATRSIDWQAATYPHPRARTYARHWLQMEWINFIRGLDADRDPTSTFMIGTTVKPEKEMEYRTLHQTVWPGVVDQATRGNIRNLNIFLVELDDQLVEFLYLEYMGKDQQSDDAANKEDPINQRWWRLTDACQQPFSDVTDGIWAALSPVE